MYRIRVVLAFCVLLLGTVAPKIAPAFWHGGGINSCWNVAPGQYTTTCTTPITNAGSCGPSGTANGTCFIAVAAAGTSGCAAHTTQAAAQSDPCDTLNHGIAQLRSGASSDWLLLKSGDTFKDQDFNGSGTGSGGLCAQHGISPTQPLLIGVYGSGARPIVEPPINSGLAYLSAGGGGCGAGGSNIAIIGIYFYNYTSDPGNGGFASAVINGSVSGNTLTVNSVTSGTVAIGQVLTDTLGNLSNATILSGSGSTWTLGGGAQSVSSEAMGAAFQNSGIELLNPVNWFLIDDCDWNFFVTPLNVEPSLVETGQFFVNRSILRNSYASGVHSSGMFTTTTIGSVSVLETIMDHNGWNATAFGAGTNGFNHNAYIDASVTFSGNISSNDSSGIQLRDGGAIQHNAFIFDPYGHNIGLRTAGATLVDDNVHMFQRDNTNSSATATINTFSSYVSTPGTPYNAGTATYSNNLMSASLKPNSNGGTIVLDPGQRGSTIAGNNIGCDWQSSTFTDQSMGSILTYNAIAAPGSGYPDGTYSDKNLSYVTSGPGTGAYGTFVVSGGGVNGFTQSPDTNDWWGGHNYSPNDDLTTPNSNLGGSGSGFHVHVATVYGGNTVISNGGYSHDADCNSNSYPDPNRSYGAYYATLSGATANATLTGAIASVNGISVMTVASITGTLNVGDALKWSGQTANDFVKFNSVNTGANSCGTGLACTGSGGTGTYALAGTETQTSIAMSSYTPNQFVAAAMAKLTKATFDPNYTAWCANSWIKAGFGITDTCSP